VGVAFNKSNPGYLYLLLNSEKYGGTRGIEGPVTWIDPGKDCHPPGGKLWLGRVGNAYPDQVFYRQPLCAIQFEVPSENAMGQDKGGKFLQVFPPEE
jgi:hypothetical protein